jgi:DNA-binding transcriptional regulator/RsmH inhibitor MraZ
MKSMQECLEIWQSEAYQNRVRELEEEGCTTSDAQGVADVEFGALPKIIKGGLK